MANQIELDILFQKLGELQSRKTSYFGDGEVYYGDTGYQAILSELEEVQDEIHELLNTD